MTGSDLCEQVQVSSSGGESGEDSEDCEDGEPTGEMDQLLAEVRDVLSWNKQ